MLGGGSQTPAPFSPSVEALLVYERMIDPQPEMVRARALARARAALRQPTLVPRHDASPLRRLLTAAAAGVLLVAGGAAAYQMLRRPEPKAPEGMQAGRTARRTSVAPPVPQALPDPTPSSTRDVALAETPSLPGRGTGVVASTQTRPEELRLLVRARRADARDDYRAVLTVLAEHERRYPSGRLSEEREALRVKALVGLGRAGEARQAAAKFRRQFPHSVLLHKIDDLLASLR